MSTYATTNEVRQASGVAGNPNITTASIDTKRLISYGLINGKIGQAYSLPITEAPRILKGIEIELAASLILRQEYGVDAQGSDKDWQPRYDAMVDILDEISKRNYFLINDTTGVELTTNSLRQPAFLPNDTTNASDSASVSTAPHFGINDKF